MTGRSKRKTALLNSGTLSPNPWDLSLSGQNGWPYTEGTRTEDKAPQGCDLSAASSAGMAVGGVDPDAAPNQHPDPSNINLLRAQNGLDNGVHRTYRSPLLLALYGVLLRHKHPLHPTGTIRPDSDRRIRSSGCPSETLEFVLASDFLRSPCVFASGRRTPIHLPFSRSSCAGINDRFRIILYWTILTWPTATLKATTLRFIPTRVVTRLAC